MTFFIRLALRLLDEWVDGNQGPGGIDQGPVSVGVAADADDGRFYAGAMACDFEDFVELHGLELVAADNRHGSLQFQILVAGQEGAAGGIGEGHRFAGDCERLAADAGIPEAHAVDSTARGNLPLRTDALRRPVEAVKRKIADGIHGSLVLRSEVVWG